MTGIIGTAPPPRWHVATPAPEADVAALVAELGVPHALAALLARHPRDVRIVWHSFPIVPDGDGRTAANFALAARKAGGDKAFWLVHRALLDARAAVDAPALGKVVKELGMDGEGLLSAARSREYLR